MSQRKAPSPAQMWEICENDYYSADELKAYAQEMLDAFESETSPEAVRKG